MALTARVEQQLVNSGLVAHFDANRPAYLEMARQAYAYSEGYVVPTGLPVRTDDVNEPLTTALRVSEPLKTYLAGERMTQQYWPVWFGYLILDRLWEELTQDDREPEQRPGDE